MSRDMKDVIKKLLALAGNNPNENEAKAAMLKARKLMAQYKLTESDIEDKTENDVVKEEVGVSCTAMTESWMLPLSATIAEHYCCVGTAFRKHGSKTYRIAFTGLEDDYAVCKQIFLYAVECIRQRCKEIKKENDWRSSSSIRELCNAYGIGFCKGLSDAFDEQDRNNQEYAIVLVTPEKVHEATKHMKRNNAKLHTGKDTYGSSVYASEGYADGKRFDPTTKLENEAPSYAELS